MFASSRYPMPAARRCEAHSASAPEEGEGRDCEACRRATAELLLPRGRPGAWLLVLAAFCAFVVVEVVRRAG